MRSKDNAQYMVGIPRNSAMLQFYLAEAQKQGVKLPTYIYQLLKDRYEALQGRGNAIWFPRGIRVAAIQQEKQEMPEHSDKGTAAMQMFGREDED